MELDRWTKILLALIVVFLGILIFRPMLNPAPVLAQADAGYPFYVEPGYTQLRKPERHGAGLWEGRYRHAQRRYLGLSNFDAIPVSDRQHRRKTAKVALYVPGQISVQRSDTAWTVN